MRKALFETLQSERCFDDCETLLDTYEALLKIKRDNDGDHNVPKSPLEDTPPPTSAPPLITDEDREKCVYAGRIVNWIKKPNSNEEIPKVFNEVMNYLGGKNLKPSNRVVKAINVYIANAQGILEEKQAADFVFQQRVIPLLQGRGEKFKDTMEDLKKTLENSNMHRSAGHIKRAIARAGDYDDIDLLGY